jgi:hypothetical protein
MENDQYIGLAVLLGIIAIAAFGGFKNSALNQSTNGTATQTQTQTLQQQIQSDQSQVSDLQAQLAAKNYSPYYGSVSIQYVNRSTDLNHEYIVLRVNSNATPMQITGWRLQSVSSGQGTTIPDGVQLYFTGQVNGTAPIVANHGDTIYLLSGVSPIGYNFRLNKCSGYLSQYQTFIPYISTSCPSPRIESSTTISNIVGNNACLDYIDNLPSCRVPTGNPPVGWSYQCVNFITTKLNYNSCIDAHKNDGDFYLKEWRVYLGRGQTLWQSEREDIVLYDANGKIVSELTY